MSIYDFEVLTITGENDFETIRSGEEVQFQRQYGERLRLDGNVLQRRTSG
ncbi:hypothetical protein ACFQ3W_20730 [Paenibacillus puldeungensis]|uniref:Uncharacterized protein n=1 Tax=Paenibacillus puldeungensis TaxID=696536 RepID=A0ABW3S3F4_9BACL